MAVEYLFDKVDETELMDESLSSLIPGSIVSSSPRSNSFISYGDGLVDKGFHLGNLVTNHIDKITIRNLTSYVLTIPKNGGYSVSDTKNEERSILGKSGVLALPMDKLIYDSATENVNDYVIIIDKNSLDSVLSTKYNVPDFKSDLLALNMKSEQVYACFHYIESTLNMLRAFPDSRNSELVKKNLRDIATFMLIDIIAEGVHAKPIINLSPEQYFVSKAEEIMEAECKRLYTIQEVADKVFTSPRNLQRAFKKYRKYTPMQFLYRRKLLEANKIFRTHNNPFLTVKEVAFSAGILDLNRFSKNYFLQFGKYPKEALRK